MWAGEGRPDPAGGHAESHRASGRSVHAVWNAAAAGSTSHAPACAPASHHHPHSHHPHATPSRRSTRPANLPGEVSSQISPVCKLFHSLVVWLFHPCYNHKVRCFLVTVFFNGLNTYLLPYEKFGLARAISEMALDLMQTTVVDKTYNRVQVSVPFRYLGRARAGFCFLSCR